MITMEPPSNEEYMTIEDVMKKLKVSRDTVTRLIAKGELRAKKIGRIWRISQQALDEYMGDKPRKNPEENKQASG